jgi:hypothetical protein
MVAARTLLSDFSLLQCHRTGASDRLITTSSHPRHNSLVEWPEGWGSTSMKNCKEPDGRPTLPHSKSRLLDCFIARMPASEDTFVRRCQPSIAIRRSTPSQQRGNRLLCWVSIINETDMPLVSLHLVLSSLLTKGNYGSCKMAFSSQILSTPPPCLTTEPNNEEPVNFNSVCFLKNPIDCSYS